MELVSKLFDTPLYIGPTCQKTERMVNSQLAESSFLVLSVTVDIIDPLLTA